jgi:gas vesicle protein
MADSIYGFLLGAILGFVVGLITFQDSYHEKFCQEQFTHAETAADTLNIVQNDKFCLEYSK